MKRIRDLWLKLWTPRFIVAWCGCLATVLAFDVLWCLSTTFRSLGFAGTYINAALLASVLALPMVICRRTWIQLITLLTFDILLITNLMYCQTYFNSIPLTSYGLVGNVIDFTASIIDSLRWNYLILPAIALATWVLMHRYDRNRKPSLPSYCAFTAMLLLISLGTSLCYGGFRRHVEWLKGECYYATTPAAIYTVPGTLLAEALENSEEITPEEIADVKNWLSTHSALQSPSYIPTDTATIRKNLVVILCESLESWPIGKTIENKEITPCLNDMVADSTTFYRPNVLSQVGNGRSIDGQLLMLAGMYPMQNYVYSLKYADNRYYAIPDAMRRAGAATYLLNGDKPSTWNQGLISSAFGIDHLEMDGTWDTSELIGNPKRLADESFIAQSIEKMKSGAIWPVGEKAYLQVVTYSGHNPFIIPEEKRKIDITGRDLPDKLTNYIRAANYTDHAVGMLVNYLKTRPDWNETMVVIVGDHEGLAKYRDAILESPQAQKIVSRESYIPFIILNPAVGGTDNRVMGQVDVYTTILDQMQLPYPWRGMGFSALDANSPGEAFDNFGVSSGHAVDTDQRIVAHIDSGRKVSDIIIRHNLLP